MRQVRSTAGPGPWGEISTALKKAARDGVDPNTFPGMESELADELRNPDPDNPSNRSRTLLDTAREHVRNDRGEHAERIWRKLIIEGGDTTRDALVDYVDYLELRDNAASAPSPTVGGLSSESPVARLGGGSMLEARGRLVDALIWYSQAIGHLTPREIATSQWAVRMATGRRRVKWALGLEFDGIDELGHVGDVEEADRYFDVLDLLRRPRIISGWVMVWSRDELNAARERWPGRVTAESVEAYYQGVEDVLRTYNRGVLIEHTTFGAAAERAEAIELLRQTARTGGRTPEPTRSDRTGIAWPPAPNQRCWCGSDKKYKKCCAAARLPVVLQAWGPAGLRAGDEPAVGRV